MTKLLITGGTGFIGKYVLELFDKTNYEIYVLSTKQQTNLSNVKFINANLLDLTKTKTIVESIGATHLIHLAWDVTPIVYWESENNLKWLEASKNLINCFIENNGKRIVVLGTSAEYDYSAGYMTEGYTILKPQKLYGFAKNELREYLYKTSMKKDFSFVWARLFSLFGCGESEEKLVFKVFKKLNQEKEFTLTKHNLIRDYLYVRDVAEAIVKLFESNYRGEINICSGNPITLGELCDYIGNIMGKPNLIVKNNGCSDYGEYPMIVGNPSKLFNTINWRPKYSIETALTECIENWRSVK